MYLWLYPFHFHADLGLSPLQFLHQPDSNLDPLHETGHFVISAQTDIKNGKNQAIPGNSPRWRPQNISSFTIEVSLLFMKDQPLKIFSGWSFIYCVPPIFCISSPIESKKFCQEPGTSCKYLQKTSKLSIYIKIIVSILSVIVDQNKRYSMIKGGNLHSNYQQGKHFEGIDCV